MGRYLYEYQESRDISSGLSFASLIMAAYRKADTGNAARLRLAFPDICTELDARYNAPGGRLESD